MPVELARELQSEDKPRILDVREELELQICALPDTIHIPLRELGQRWSELDPEANWVVVCRSGPRSAQATAFLLSQGFRSVRNLELGLVGYAMQVDRSMRIY